jgi:hypothetical protein
MFVDQNLKPGQESDFKILSVPTSQDFSKTFKVLRIRDVYPGSRIHGQKGTGSGSSTNCRLGLPVSVGWYRWQRW